MCNAANINLRSNNTKQLVLQTTVKNIPFNPPTLIINANGGHITRNNKLNKQVAYILLEHHLDSLLYLKPFQYLLESYHCLIMV